MDKTKRKRCYIPHDWFKIEKQSFDPKSQYEGAQYRLGEIYSDNDNFEFTGIRHDYSKAIDWYEKSAEQGFARAQYNLYCMYLRGKGVAKDTKKAAKWIEMYRKRDNNSLIY